MTTSISLALAARDHGPDKVSQVLLEEAASLDELARYAPRPFAAPAQPTRSPGLASMRAALSKIFS